METKIMKKPRIAIYYDNRFGRNDGPPLYYYNVFLRMGLEALHLIPEGDTRQFGKFDYHFWVDYGEDGLPVDHEWFMPKDGGKTIYVCSDAHIDKGGREYRFNFAKKFDYVFFNQPKFVKQYLKFAGVTATLENDTYEIQKAKIQVVKFLPHAAEQDAYPHTEQIKKYDVCFIGHINGENRIDMLDRLFKEFPNFYFGTRSPQDPAKNMFDDAAKHFNESRVVLNISIKDDLNMRLFEILSAGAFELTNYLPTLKDIGIKDGKHLVTYKSLDEMVKLIKYYLKHGKEREKIAEEGHKFFLENHTYQHRIEEIFRTIENGTRKNTNTRLHKVNRSKKTVDRSN